MTISIGAVELAIVAALVLAVIEPGVFLNAFRAVLRHMSTVETTKRSAKIRF